MQLERWFSIVSNYRNKDKNVICIKLELIRVNIEGWYNDIIDKFSSRLAHEMRVELSELPEIIKCAQDRTRRSRVEKSRIFIESIQNEYNSKNLKNIKDRLDMDVINNIYNMLKEFKDSADDKKDLWMNKHRKHEPVNPDEVILWQKNLDDFRRIINESCESDKSL